MIADVKEALEDAGVQADVVHVECLGEGTNSWDGYGIQIGAIIRITSGEFIGLPFFIDIYSCDVAKPHPFHSHKYDKLDYVLLGYGLGGRELRGYILESEEVIAKKYTFPDQTLVAFTAE